ncbi:MAG: helix-turn-helix domain-containing protein [Gracilibacteraceae bacterium]|nr:helix-turn-helix domain-containing protein [Gracilibacteraceae bacterium]
MEIREIIAKLQAFQPRLMTEGKNAALIHTYSVVSPGQKQFFPACLYVGCVSQLAAEPDTDSPCNLICVEDVPLPAAYLRGGAERNIYLAPAGAAREDLLKKVGEIMLDEAVIVSGKRRLFAALHSNRGLQYLIDVASDIFGNPIFVSDTAFQHLAHTRETVFADAAMEEQKELGCIHETIMQALKRSMIFEKAHQSDKTIVDKKPRTDETWMFRSVRIEGVVVADIAIVDYCRPFKDTDHKLLNHLSEILSIAIEKNDFFETNKGVMFNYFLTDLLSGKVKSLKSVEQRSKYLNWKLSNWFQAVVIIDHREKLFGNKIRQIGAQIRQIVPDCRWTFFEQNLTVLISRPDSGIFRGKEMSLLNDYFRSNGLSAGFSNPFFEIMDVTRHYRQALRAVETGAFVSRGRGVFHYADMMIFYAAKNLVRHDNIEEYCPAAVACLREYDLKHKTQLVETLDKWLRYTDNSAEAAKALDVHRNTLLYRINKIKELTPVDLNNGDERLKIQLYFKLLEYQKGGW